jgi:hypothetical protein
MSKIKKGVLKLPNIIVIGGGASGIVASIIAGRRKAKVTLLERNDRIGKKILVTGNGRCNYTNFDMRLDYFHGSNRNFIDDVLKLFDRDDTLDFFEKLGIIPKIEEGKIFPMSLQSSSVLDVLRYELERLKVNVVTGAYVTEISKKKEFEVKIKSGEVFHSDKVIIATGGMAMPVSGSDGNGYKLAKEFGHSIITPTPSLVQLKLESDKLKAINGVKFEGLANLYIDSKLIRQEKGEILFTDYGISGPPILQLSREAVRGMNEKRKVELELKLFDKSREEFKDYLSKRFSYMPYKTVEIGLIGLINKKLIIPILKEINLDKSSLVKELTNVDLDKLANILTSWKFKVIGDKGWGQAQSTAGGILTQDIDPNTLESKRISGLYFCGEILDVDGDCGGYNLQWAWSSGYVAGLNASK